MSGFDLKNFDFKKFKEECDKERDTFSVEEFLKENDKKMKKIEELLKTGKVTHFSYDFVDKNERDLYLKSIIEKYEYEKEEDVDLISKECKEEDNE